MKTFRKGRDDHEEVAERKSRKEKVSFKRSSRRYSDDEDDSEENEERSRKSRLYKGGTAEGRGAQGKPDSARGKKGREDSKRSEDSEDDKEERSTRTKDGRKPSREDVKGSRKLPRGPEDEEMITKDRKERVRSREDGFGDRASDEDEDDHRSWKKTKKTEARAEEEEEHKGKGRTQEDGRSRESGMSKKKGSTDLEQVARPARKGEFTEDGDEVLESNDKRSRSTDAVRRKESDSKERSSRKLQQHSREDRDRAKDKSAKDEDVGESAEERKKREDVERRRKRMQEWQQMRAKSKEDRQLETKPDASSKNWSLEDESDDEDADGHRVPHSNNLNDDSGFMERKVKEEEDEGNIKFPSAPDPMQGIVKEEEEEEEVDPLDAFMSSLEVPKSADPPPHQAPKDTAVGAGDEPVKMEDGEEEPEANGTAGEGAEGKQPQQDPKAGEDKTGKKGGGKEKGKKGKKRTGPQVFGMDSDSDDEVGGDEGDDEVPQGKQHEEDDAAFVKRVASQTKADKLPPVDHSQIEYPPFRKAFYREVKEIERMSAEEVQAFRKENEFKIQGKNIPKPVRTWNQTGLSSKILDQIKKMGFEKPMPIQAQTLPVIMSGRDCIGIAKTGSGKTLAFVLPMLRHILDQPPLEQGDGPIGLILAPTRELVQQIYTDIRKFTKPLGLHCVPVYGGSGVAQQIGELKRGTEIVVCTPGRMIDILCTSNGKISNLRRVTYVVMDEADRMFDMGFEPQIAKIIQNVRPHRQTVLFSATFPRSVETLARQVLDQPVTIQVGGRSVVNKDIDQIVEIRPEGQQRFLRLLELLGEWGEKGKVLVFTHTQDKCDALFRDLLKSGYPCLSLHGAKDQTDRESTITDFKSGVANLLIATSVAARGLDVKELELVVNYDVPNHYEDYVHRVGRTGRAGNKGTAVTFLSIEEERYAPDLVRALELSEQPIPEDLKSLADSFAAKVKAGTVTTHGSGYGGSGFKFNEEEEEAKKALKKAQAKEYGVEEEEESEEEDENDGIRKVEAGSSQDLAAAFAAASKDGASGPASIQAQIQLRMAQMGVTAAPSAPAPGVLGAGVPAPGVPGVPGIPVVPPAPAAAGAASAVSQAAAFAAAISLQHALTKLNPQAAEALQAKEHYELDFEINDFPQHARWKITHKETLNQINEWTGADVTIRGVHVPPGKKPDPTTGERKLYLFVSGPTESSVRKAKAEIKRILEEATAASIAHSQSHGQPGKYSVL